MSEEAESKYDQSENEPLVDTVLIVQNEALDTSSFFVPSTKENRTYECKQCQDVFISKDKLALHYVMNHKFELCSICMEVAETVDLLKDHQNEQHFPLRCESCQYSTNSIDDMSFHREDNHKLLSCPLCSVMLSNNFEKENHVKRKHFVLSKDFSIQSGIVSEWEHMKWGYKCLLCNKTREKREIVGHFRGFHRLSIYALIKNLFSQNVVIPVIGTINSAKTTGMPQPIKNSSCSSCNYSSVIPELAHNVLCFGEFLCKYCPSSFPSEDQREVHKTQEHSQLECKLECENAAFKSEDTLQTHYLTVHKARICNLCEINVPLPDISMNDHLKKVHKYTNLLSECETDLTIFKAEEKTNGFLLSCVLCGFDLSSAFVDVPVLFDHISQHNINLNVALYLLDDLGFFRKRFNFKGKIEVESSLSKPKAANPGVMKPGVIERPFSSGLTDTLQEEIDNQSDMENEEVEETEENPEDIIVDDHFLHSVFSRGKDKTKLLRPKTLLSDKTGEYDEERFTEQLSGDGMDESCSDYDPNEEDSSDDYSDTDVEKQKKSSDQQDDDDDGLELFNIVPEIDPNEVECYVTESSDVDDDEEVESQNIKLDELDLGKHLDDIQLLGGNSDKNSTCSSYFISSVRIGLNWLEHQPNGFVCEVCSGRFEPKEGLRELLRHMRILHGFKSNVSTQNMLSQFDNFGRVKEIFSHIGPVFPCPFCPIRSSSKRLLRRHAIKFHGDTWLQDPPEGPMAFKCSICPVNFWQMNERSAHEYSNHGDAATLRCYHCWEPFFRKIMLNQHIKKSHPNAPLYTTVSYKCRQCRALCPSYELLRNHFKDQHPNITVFRCPHCDVTLKTKKSLKAHFKGQHLQESGMYECDQCGKTVWSKRALGAHKRLKHMNSRLGFRCRLCGLRFGNKDERKLHYQGVHAGESPYHCSECGKGFASKSGLYGHRQVHKSTDYFKCQYCEKEFTRKDSYNEHLLIHIGPRHRCPHCSKEFVQRSNMIRHIRIHTGEKPYKCSYCDKTFSDKGACNSHIRVHTGEETCACPFCGQTFSKKQKLKYHVRKHTGEGLVNCEVCNKVFTNTYTLKEHKLTHAKITKSKEAVCKHCGEAFDSTKFLQRHAAIAHTNGVIFGCPFCEKIFTQQARLRSHIMAHADVKHLRCLLCEDAYSERRELQKHLSQKHNVDTGSPHYLTCFRIITPEEIGLYIPMFHEDDFSQQTNIERDKILREYFAALTSGKIQSKDNQTVKFNFKLLATPKRKKRSKTKESFAESVDDFTGNPKKIERKSVRYNLRENGPVLSSDSNEASVIDQTDEVLEDPADQMYLAHLAKTELIFSPFEKNLAKFKKLGNAESQLDVSASTSSESASPKKSISSGSPKKREKQKRKSKALPPRKLQVVEGESNESEDQMDFSYYTDESSLLKEDDANRELPEIPKITVKKSLKKSKFWAIKTEDMANSSNNSESSRNPSFFAAGTSDADDQSTGIIEDKS